jgi:hypothetical protein
MKTHAIPTAFKSLFLTLALMYTHHLSAQLEVLYENVEQDGLFRHIKEDYQQNILTGGFRYADLSLGSINLLVSEGQNFIAKYNPSSSTFTWANQVKGNVWLADLATDASGNTYITGRYQGVATFDNITLTSTKYKVQGQWYNSPDIYVAKADPNGAFVWAKTFGTNVGTDASNAVCTDASGNVYFAGYYASKSGSRSKQDLYVGKLNSSGGSVWQKRITPSGCNDYASANGLAVDASNHVSLKLDQTLSAGMYYVSAQSGDEISTKRLVINR